MRFRGVLGALAAAGMAAGLLGLGSPAAAVNPDPLVVTNVRTGANPVVAGSSQGTEFTITVTNPNDFAVPVELVGNVQAGGLLQQVTTKDDRAACQTSGNMFACRASQMNGALAPKVPDDDRPALAPGETLTVYAKYAADAWVPPSTLNFCTAASFSYVNLRNGVMPCGITPSGAQSAVNGTGWVEQFASFDVVALTDLVLARTDAPQTVPGQPATVSFALQDLGPSLVTGYRIVVTIPEGMTFVSAGPDPWKCTHTGRQVECVWQLPLLRSQPRKAPALTPLSVVVNTPNPATKAQYEIQATGSTSASDPTPATVTAVVPMTPVDLAVTKSAGSPVFVADEATWTVKVSNVGTIEDAGKITVTDTLPAGAVFKSATGEGWTCAVSGQQLTCEHTHGTLPVGASEEIVVISRMTQRGAATNTVSVATTAFEENLANNTAEKSVRVIRSAQEAPALPSSPRRILSGTTDQGQKLRTRVRCTPVKSSAAGEASYCRVTRGKGVVRVNVMGSKPMRVKVVQTARGTNKFRPFLQRKTYVVRP